MTQRPNYGIDAPNVIRNLLIACVVCVILALWVRSVTVAHIRFDFYPGFLYSAAAFGIPAVLMLLYAKVGKFHHRDRMLGKVAWTGAEMVLDVGTGRGLLLIGAATRLTTGHATGIDIWNAEDLSGNGPEGLLSNISLEGVGGKTTVKSENACQMNFPDGTFDVVLSNLCLHNIYDQAGRSRACHEIARVLKTGGAAVISDYKHVKEYRGEFIKCGLNVEMCPLERIDTFPPLRILVARKRA